MTISSEKLADILRLAQDYDFQSSDDEDSDEDVPLDDDLAQRLWQAIDDLDDDEKYDLASLVVLGRDGLSESDWEEVRDNLMDEVPEDEIADYLLRMSDLSDWIEAGLENMEYSLEDDALGASA